MHIASFQFDVRRGEPAANLARVEEGIEAARAAGVSLLALPEMWPTSFAVPTPELVAASERAVGRAAELAGRAELVLVGSAFAPSDDAERPFNRLHVAQGGEVGLTFDKVHLFSPTAETESFRAGSEPPRALDTPAGRVAGVVCYDLRFGPLVRRCFLEGAEILICPAQWPRPRAGHWEALLRGRAVENQCYVVGANRTGIERVGRRELELDFPGNSTVIAPDGSCLAQGCGDEGLVLAEIDLDVVRRLRRRVPVQKDQRDDLYRRWL